MIDELITYLSPQLGKCKKVGSQLRFCCPDCDKGEKYNLEICCNPNSVHYKKFNCWGCPLKGNVRGLLSKYAIDNSWRNIDYFKFNKINDFIKEENKQQIILPNGLISFSLHQEAVNYLLKERNLERKILIERNVLYCYSEEESLFNHLIFPFYENKRLIGYSSQNLSTKKYRNHRDLNFIAYDEFINWNFPIIITEGIYDCYSVVNAIPTLGLELSKTLLNKVKEKKIILAFDNNYEISYEEKVKRAKQLYKYDAKIVDIFDLKEYKDLNDYKVRDADGLRNDLKNTFEKLNLI